MPRLLYATAAAALATGAAGSHGAVHDSSAEAYKVGGACDVGDGIDGLIFVKHGVTHNGSPYFKATTSDKYLYFDPDCEGGSGEPKRWIFDTDEPDVTKNNDLDGDNACNFIGRIDSEDASHPPSGDWTMLCDGVEEELHLTLEETEAPGEEEQEEGAAEETAEEEELDALALVPGGKVLTWEGACDFKSFLEGEVFEEVGVTADGRPFFKAQNAEEYIYFDADCDGEGSISSARWVMDNGRPSTSATEDLDKDGKCDYHARFDGDDKRPPFQGDWTMYCGAEEGWTAVPVTLHESDEATSAHVANAAQRHSVLLAAFVTVAAAYMLPVAF